MRGHQCMKKAGTRFVTAGLLLTGGLLSGCIQEFRDSNIQSFAAGEAVVLDGKQLYFTGNRLFFDEVLAEGDTKLTPIWGQPPYWFRAVTEQSEFPVDPTEHTLVDFSESDPFYILGSNSGNVPSPFLGTYIGSDGTISFSEPGTGNGSFAEFFSSTQISLLPLDATVTGARVTYGVVSGLLVITFQNVDGNDVQCIQADNQTDTSFPGTGPIGYSDIVITYKQVSENTRAGVVGIAWADYLRDATAEEATEFRSYFDEEFGGEVNLAESTNVESGGYTRIVDLP